MSRREERFSWYATILGFIVDLREAVIWLLPVIFGLFSNTILLLQPEPPEVPGLQVRLGPWYQFALLLTALLVYLHYLRRRWIKDQSTEDPLSESFREFMLTDLPSLKRPLLLIPLPFFVILWVSIAVSAVNPTTGEGLWFGSLLLMILILGAIFAAILSVPPLELWKYRERWDTDEERKARWIERIRRVLESNESVTTLDFAENVGLNLLDHVDNEEVNWALRMYFHLHEFEERLTLSDMYRVYSAGKSIKCYKLSISRSLREQG